MILKKNSFYMFLNYNKNEFYMYLNVTLPVTLSNMIVVCLYFQMVSVDTICNLE